MTYSLFFTSVLSVSLTSTHPPAFFCEPTGTNVGCPGDCQSNPALGICDTVEWETDYCECCKAGSNPECCKFLDAQYDEPVYNYIKLPGAGDWEADKHYMPCGGKTLEANGLCRSPGCCIPWDTTLAQPDPLVGLDPNDKPDKYKIGADCEDGSQCVCCK